MERTWRWFGKKDKITLAQLKQIGVEGMVKELFAGEGAVRKTLHKYVSAR